MTDDLRLAPLGGQMMPQPVTVFGMIVDNKKSDAQGPLPAGAVASLPASRLQADNQICDIGPGRAGRHKITAGLEKYAGVRAR